LQPLLEGGGQERDLRAGTVNVGGAVAMAAALRLTTERRSVEVSQVARLRDRLLDGLADAIDGLFENGDPAHKVAGSCHVGIPGIEAEMLLVALDQAGLCAAAGSSCSSGATEPSHVLAAMGLPRADAISSIRLSLGFASTDADVDAALEMVPAAIGNLRRAGAATR
ncbi:MAG: aminotransferase class V-fold PLP-dependent enzyme, partial [Acidimicrobiia bacterium]|nr:aminotransferase class V-fold PLP-dependent enzyme [Acidimicrobiia bacterium]